MRIVRRRPGQRKSGLNHQSRNTMFAYQIKSKFTDQELQAMQRSPGKTKYRGNLFCRLAEELLWKNGVHKHL